MHVGLCGFGCVAMTVLCACGSVWVWCVAMTILCACGSVWVWVCGYDYFVCMQNCVSLGVWL